MSLVAALLLPWLALGPLMSVATPVPAQPTIPPVIWQAIAIAPPSGAVIDITDPSRYTVQFLPDGSVVIQADCNRAPAAFALDDGTLRVQPGMSTLAMCPPDSHDQAFLAALHGATGFSFDDDGHLVLTGAGGELTAQATLEGVTWEWSRFQGGDDSLVTPDDPARYTLKFLPDGKLAIRADCNRARGEWTATGSSLDLAIGGMTRALCAEGSLSNRFVEDLGYVRSHVFRDGDLHLALFADAGIMSFVAVAETTPPGTPAPQASPLG